MKNKVLQVMSAGKAVVTTTGARGIAVKNKGHVVIADNFKEFAKEMVSLLNDRSLRHRLGERAKRLVEEQYSWEIVTKTLNEVILNVLRASVAFFRSRQLCSCAPKRSQPIIARFTSSVYGHSRRETDDVDKGLRIENTRRQTGKELVERTKLNLTERIAKLKSIHEGATAH